MENSNLASRLNRIEGQVRGIRRMIEKKDDCEKILQQISAVRSALSKVAVIHLYDTLNPGCEWDNEKPGDDFLQMKKLFETISRY